MSKKVTKNGNPDNIVEAMGFEEKPLFKKYETFHLAVRDLDHSDQLKKLVTTDWSIEEKLLYAFMEGKWVNDMEWQAEMLTAVTKGIKAVTKMQEKKEAPDGTAAH